MQLGLATFADVAPGAPPRRVAERLRELLEEIELADRLGLEVFGLGEHHRRDYAVSAPTVALAAAAARTEHIRLSTAVTVLSSADPVTVFEEFATLDLLSGGRAEIMAGRGSFTESFPLYGYDLEDYDDLFAEKLELLLALRESEQVTWSGKHRAALHRSRGPPAPSAAATAGVDRRRRIAELDRACRRTGPTADDRDHRRAAGQVRAAGRSLSRSRAAHRGRHLAHAPSGSTRICTSPTAAQRARDEFFGPYSQMMNRIGRERGWPPMSRAQFDAGCGPDGHLLVGTPEEVERKDPRPARAVRPRPLPRPHQRRRSRPRARYARDRAVRLRGRPACARDARDRDRPRRDHDPATATAAATLLALSPP